ncbi:MAG: two-component regulator propeller domain-containing protein [Bacteroidota bacterium]
MRIFLAIFCKLVLCNCLPAQQSTINFQKLGLQQGLHDGTIRCIGQDKYGFVWIGSVGALNRFDGKKVTHFTNIPGDSTSPYGSQPRCIYTDRKGRLWIGFESGLMNYDFASASFKKCPSVNGAFTGKIVDASDSILFLATRSGLIRFNTITGSSFFYALSQDPLHAALKSNAVFDIAVRNDSLYLATQKGLVVMKKSGGLATKINIPAIDEMGVYAIATDKDGNIWMGLHNRVKLLKLKTGFQQLEIFDKYLTADINTQALNVMDILVDSRNRVWVATAVDGLLQYDSSNNGFIKHLHNNFLLSSLSDNNHRCIFQDQKGIIWLGGDFTGVDFFEPDNNFFKTIFPFPDRLDERARQVGRAVAEDQQGNIWMGSHDGVTRYNPVSKQYTVWRNIENKKPVLYNNVVRAMYCDAENNTWIGTASGVNRYNHSTGIMEFIALENLPGAFYNSITGDRSGNIWFCLNDDAVLYWYDTSEKTYHNISDHPQLKPYKSIAATSYVLEDSKNRLWISFSRKGVIMLDKKTNVVKHYLASGTNSNSIIGNQVVDIKEDQKGVIWLTSFNGVSGINVEADTIISFNNKNGLAGNWVGPLVVDNANRIWMGVNGGLTMLHPDRKQITSFSLSDGLSSLGYPEHAGIQTSNGDIMIPSYNGFIRFTPGDYQEEKTALHFYLSHYTIFDKHYDFNSYDTNPSLNLKPTENSFAFDLVALNFIHPTKTWFAYKLEGFEKEWHYTQDAKAVYTNVPGGDYTFLYKASGNQGNWDEIAPKKLSVNLDTIFYKSTVFRIIFITILVAMFFGVYQYRIRQQREVFHLKSKAEALEKEKTLVQYESLKQHLNPHFLFNSLTSLRSLIKTDSKNAARFLDGMSKIYRYVLRSGEQELVMVQDEIEFVKTFAELQQVRFGQGLEVTINISEAQLHRFIAPVVLQNLVENAIKHNTTSTDQPLVITIFSEQDYVVVCNNMQRYRVVETSNKSGLASLQKLYGYYTDKKIDITENEDEFRVRIPLL